MTEKVVSLSGGLVLGMAFTLFLSVSTTQTMTSPMNIEYPSVSGLVGLNDLQSYRSSSSDGSQARDTTPATSVAQPVQEEDRGRIVRIATVTETTDPVLQASPSGTNAIPKTLNTAGNNTNGGSTLQQMHQQHTYVADNTTGSYATVGQIARQSGNFTEIADNGGFSGHSGNYSGGQPSAVDGKPQTNGTPSIGQNDPGTEEGEGEEDDPALAGFSPRPPDPDVMNVYDRHHVEPYNPDFHHNSDIADDHHGGHHPDPHGPSLFQNDRRPETD